MGLEAIYQAPRTSTPHPTHRIYPYLLKIGIEIDRPNQVWCADITYIPVQRGFLYLIAIMDWATRHVLSWRLSNTMDARFCIDALNAALADYGNPEISNTDQGSQFTGFDFTGVLKNAGVRISMDGRGRCSGQHLHRAAVAVAEIRGRFYLHELTDGFTAERVIGEVDRLLQHRAAPFGPSAVKRRRKTFYGAGQPVDMMDKPDGLPTSPQAQQQQQDVINTILAA